MTTQKKISEASVEDNNVKATPAQVKSIEPKQTGNGPVLTGQEQASAAMKEIVGQSRWGFKGKD
jgi:hypothetical protein